MELGQKMDRIPGELQSQTPESVGEELLRITQKDREDRLQLLELFLETYNNVDDEEVEELVERARLILSIERASREIAAIAQ